MSRHFSTSPRFHSLRVLSLLGAVFIFPACSSSESSEKSSASSDAGNNGDAASLPPPRERPAGPAAKLEENTGANPPFIGAAPGTTLPSNYVEHEYIASGKAVAYQSKAAAPLTDDGHWTFETTTSADYVTRILVRRPANVADFSGTVIVEWLNVSGGVDANPDYTSLVEEILRKGHAWVGVSAQLIGVEGGNVLVSVPGAASDLAGKGLKKIDPERYGTLSHPGDGYSFDVFTQVARALLQGGDVLGGVKPSFVLAAGESQSAIALTTYYDGVQPLTLAFDGFFVHSRGAMTLPLVEPGTSADLAGSIGSTLHPVLRDDLDAPVIDLQAESDTTGVLGSVAVRQPDTDTFRLWEVAGTAHADRHLLGSIADTIDCGVPINDGPLHLVAKAAFRGFEAWVRTGTSPVAAPRLEMATGATPAVARDADGIALGGIRTPPVDVPVDVLSGVAGPNASLICILLGSTTPLTAARIAALYANGAEYQQKYATKADAAIHGGFVLEDDRDALMAYSKPGRVSP